jgi:hypothetical protein
LPNQPGLAHDGGGSAFCHLARSVLGARYHSKDALFAMLTCYFDEAGGSDIGYTVVAGWAASVEQWDRFEADWRIFLAKYDVSHFHMKQYAQSSGPFRKWKGGQWEGTRKNFMRDAAHIILSNAQRGFISLVPHESFAEIDRRYKLRDFFSSEYAFVGRACVAGANQWWNRTRSSPLDMKYIFEDGGPDKGGLIQSMTAFPPYLPSPAFEPSRNIAPSRKWPQGRTGVIQLQAADYLGYEIRKLLMDVDIIKTGERTFRRSLLALRGIQIDRCLYTSERIETMCKAGNIPSRR